MKTQLLIDPRTRRVIATHFGAGSQQDLALFKENQLKLHATTQCLGDLGYVGLKRYHANAEVPHRRPKGQQLRQEQKHTNRSLARRRIVVEHVIGRLKVFKILAGRYRNRCQRFDLRFNLIAAIYNFELPA